MPSGSYVVEVFSAKYVFEPVRVDISGKGNARARKVNHLRPSQVALLKYPLEMKPISYAQYFQVREKFSIFEMLKSPMVSTASILIDHLLQYYVIHVTNSHFVINGLPQWMLTISAHMRQLMWEL